MGPLGLLLLLTRAAAPAAPALPPPGPTSAPIAFPVAMLPGADNPAPAGRRRAGIDPVLQWRGYSIEASRRFAIPLEWIEEVMRAESGGRTHLAGRPITSRAGAMGLMQIMPATWIELRARLGLGSDPHAPRDNILAGSFYLRMMHDRFGYPGLFGAYNAGPGRYAGWLAGRTSLPAETRAYMAVLAGSAPAARARRDLSVRPRNAPTAAEGLFAVRREAGAIAGGAPVPGAAQTRPQALFVPLATPAGSPRP